MKWWPRRKGPDIDHGAADAALQSAEKCRAEAQRRWPEVADLTQSLRESRERVNHFRESMSVALRLGE